MFGLKTPIARADRKDEFDSVATILSQSLITKPPHIIGLPGWLSSIGDDGGIFHLELPSGVDTKLVRLSSGDGGSVSSLTLGVGCNSEDTGYSSDQDLNSPDIHNSNVRKQEKRINLLSNEINSSHSVKLFRTSRVSSSAQQESEPICGRKSKKCKTPKTGRFSCRNFDSSHIYSCLDEGNDDGVFLNKSDLRSSKTSTISTNSSGSHCSHASGSHCSHASGSHCSHASCASNSCCNYQVLYKSDFQKNGRSDRCAFNSSSSKKYGNCLDWKTVNVEVKLNAFRFRTTSQSSFCNSEGILCEQLLGIVPTYKDDNCRSSCSDVIVKGLLPDCDVALRRPATLGSWLHSINGQELTWYNMDTLLSSLSKLKKVKLTLKSLKPENSTVDLEALVNILTADTRDHHGLDNMAAMYISLDGVNPDDPSNTNDGMVYSFPTEKNSLHLLQGMFYTLAHLVKDIKRSSSIQNTTLNIDKEKVHVAYLQECSDILVLAMPASCVSVSQINTLMVQFARLLRNLFGSIESVFSKGSSSVFVDNILTYLFRQVLQTSSPAPSLSSSAPGIKEKAHSNVECFPFVRYSRHIHSLSLPDDLMISVGRTLSEFESSDFADMSESFYGCRRQYNILGSAFFYCGQLVSSHMSPEDLQDIHVYLQHLGVLELTARCRVAQFVAWREVYPTRFCFDIAEINNNFGYSEPNARWCFLIVGLKHGVFCCLLETVSLPSLDSAPLSPDVFYVDQAKACLLQLQTPQLLAAMNIRVSKECQSALTKSDYCATYVNTNGEKAARLFCDNQKIKDSSGGHFMPVLQSDWRKTSLRSEMSSNSVGADSLYKSPRSGKLYPVCDHGDTGTSLDIAIPSSLSNMYRLSTTRNPSIYQYCYLDGLEGTLVTGSDMDITGIFHSQIVHNFYICCRSIHDFFVNFGEKQQQSYGDEDDDDDNGSNDYTNVELDVSLREVREHGILMTFNPHSKEDGFKSRQPLEYWVVGRRLKKPYLREMFVCFHASASQSIIELAFRMC